MNGILVIAEHLDQKVANITNELIGAAVSMSRGGYGPVTVAVIGDEPAQYIDQLMLQNIDTVYKINIGTNHFDAAAYEESVVTVGFLVRPSIILAGHTINGMTYGPMVAVRLGCGFATDVYRIENANGTLFVTRGAYGNKLDNKLSFPQKSVVLLTLRASCFPPNVKGKPLAEEDIEISATWKAISTRHVDYVHASETGVDIAKSEIILAIGRGIQDEQNIPRFAELASKIGATLGCSRPIIDSGWLPRSHQVGQSGKVASSCRIYLALGISGAVQHLQGMKHIENIVAINTDPNAPIFNIAKYGANVDIFEFADALGEEFNDIN